MQILNELRKVYSQWIVCKEMIALADTMCENPDPDILEHGMDLFDRYYLPELSLRMRLEQHLQNSLLQNNSVSGPEGLL